MQNAEPEALPAPNPHDALFRRVMGVPANAASELRAVLPPALVERLELDGLTAVPGTFVDEELRQRHSDLLFAAPMDDRETFVYVLVEHQSSTDPLMAFRMLRYVVRIWDRYLSEHPEATRLPAVIPLVLHYNRLPWAAPTQTLELIDLDPETAMALQDHLPRLRFLSDDLTRVDLQALRARALTPAAFMALYLFQKAPGNRRLPADLERVIDELRRILAGTEHFPAFLTYIQSVGEAPPDDLRKLIGTLGSDAEEAYVTTAEMLRAEGRAEVLVQLLTLRFGPLPQTALDTVHGASIDQLQVWAAAVLTAGTLEEILG